MRVIIFVLIFGCHMRRLTRIVTYSSTPSYQLAIAPTRAITPSLHRVINNKSCQFVNQINSRTLYMTTPVEATPPTATPAPAAAATELKGNHRASKNIPDVS